MCIVRSTMHNQESWRKLDIPETWRPICDHHMYEVSDCGRVRSLYPSWLGKRILRAATRKHGYKMVVLHDPDGSATGWYVHRLVAKTFLPNFHGHPVVHHKDGNPGNNHVSNLEWTTQKENIRQAMLVRGNWLKAAADPHRARTRCPIVATRPDGTRHSFASLRDAALYYDSLVVANGGVSKRPETFIGNISRASHTGKLAYGFYWRRV